VIFEILPLTENNGGVNCELNDAKCGGRNNGGCPSIPNR
jgi:hypothetical protein